jgi:hypothetical protein
MTRTIISARRADRSTLIKLDCGHERSLGGHRWFNGKPVGDPADLVRFRVAYDCQDGTCGRRQ